MRTTLTIGFMMTLLAMGTVHAAQKDDKAAFKAIRKDASAFHDSLISHVAPPVRAKMGASSAAARRYLSGCGRSCDLYSFLSKDLTARFTRLTTRERDLLIGLVFAETAATDREVDMLRLQEVVQKREQLLKFLTDIVNTEHETAAQLVSNIKP